jgi:hypothetical protein
MPESTAAVMSASAVMELRMFGYLKKGDVPRMRSAGEHRALNDCTTG